MAIHRFQVTFPTDSAIPADYVTNTWHFNSVFPVGTVDFDNVRDMLSDFYNEIPTGQSQTIGSRMSGALNTPAIVKAYALDDTPPRAPVYESDFAMTYSTSDDLPSEVALVMSFQAPRVSGQPQARRRNRVFLGPFASNALTTGTGATRGRPNSTLLNVIQAAGQDLLDAANAATNWNWIVYSPYSSAGYDVDNGWVDNAWDTQRRRGISPSARQTFS